MKTTLRIPTEQYAFIELEAEVQNPGEAVLLYAEMQAELKGKCNGLVEKDFNRSLDLYISEGKMNSEEYEAMNTEQKMIIQTIKRSIKRINYKQ